MQPWLVLCLLAFQQDSKVALNADHVWGRQYRLGAHSPLVITIDNPGRQIEGSLVIRWGLAESFQSRREVTPETLQGALGLTYEIPVTVPEKTRRRYFAITFAPSEEDSYAAWVFLTSKGRTVRAFAVPGLRFRGKGAVVATLGGAVWRPIAGTGAELAGCRVEELPNRWYGYSMLTALVWSDADAGQARDADVVEALRAWVAGGGHLVIARSTTAGFSGTFLEEIAPVTVQGTGSLDDWSGLASYAGVAEPPQGSDKILHVRPRGASVLASAGGHPLVVQRRYGRGRVTFLAFDPGATLFEQWARGPAFWERLLELPPPPSGEPERHRLYGFQGDLGQKLGSPELAYLLGLHPQVPLPSLGWAFLMIVVYVILVGPVDYFVLRRLKRMELTWVTFPACVALFSAIALIAGSTITRHPPKSRETLVIDAYSDADAMRGWSLTSVLTPTERRLTASARKPQALLTPSFTFAYGDADTGRIQEGRIEDWFFPRGATGVAILKWSEKGSPIKVERLGASSIRVTNNAGAPVGSAILFSGRSAYELDVIPVGVSTRELGKPMEWRRGVERLGASQHAEGTAEDDEWRRYGRRGYRDGDITEEGLRARLRGLLAALCFARATAPKAVSDAMAGEIDLTSWVEQGRSVLVGWSRLGGAIEFSGLPPAPATDALMRVFMRDD